MRCYAFKGHTDVVTCINFASNGHLIASSSQDRTVRLWIPTITGGSTDFQAHTAAVRTVAFSPKDDQLLSGSNDKSLKLWNVQMKQFLSSFLGHTNWVRSAKFSPDGHIIASCSDDKTLRIWDASTTQPIHTFTLGKGSGTCVDFHRGGNSIALATSSGSVRVYDIRNNKLQQHYVLHDNATSVAWHPGANYFLSTGLDGTIKIVDALEGRPLYTLEGHDSGINSACFNEGGDLFATGGLDRHVLVWRTKFLTTDSLSTCSTSSVRRVCGE